MFCRVIKGTKHEQLLLVLFVCLFVGWKMMKMQTVYTFSLRVSKNKKYVRFNFCLLGGCKAERKRFLCLLVYFFSGW